MSYQIRKGRIYCQRCGGLCTTKCSCSCPPGGPYVDIVCLDCKVGHGCIEEDRLPWAKPKGGPRYAGMSRGEGLEYGERYLNGETCTALAEEAGKDHSTILYHAEKAREAYPDREWPRDVKKGE